MSTTIELTWIQAAKEVGEMITVAVVVVLIPCVLFLLISSRTMIFGLRSFIVLTGSMEPTVPTGSIIVSQQQSKYSLGEIIAFHSANKTITHRIVGINSNQGAIHYSTKGDANNVADAATITQSQIIGRDVVLVPSLGTIAAWIKRPIGFVMLILLPAIFYVLSELLVIKREFEKDIRKKVMQQMQTV